MGRHQAGRASSGSVAEQADCVMQLTRAMDPGMRRQDLLHKGRARPRQTDDEHRSRIGITPASAAGEQFGS